MNATLVETKIIDKDTILKKKKNRGPASNVRCVRPKGQGGDETKKTTANNEGI